MSVASSAWNSGGFWNYYLHRRMGFVTLIGVLILCSGNLEASTHKFGNLSETESYMSILTLHRTKHNVVFPKNSRAHKFHLIRVPKAGSSSLSAVVRRLAGCSPPGPCCVYPGSPPGVCNATKEAPNTYNCHKIIGCTGHNAYVNELRKSWSEGGAISISMVREPIARALSAFAYVHPHTNCDYANCTDVPSAFLEFTSDVKFKNVVVKMFSGIKNPYSTTAACRSGCSYSLDVAIQNLNRVSAMGITELWGISILVLLAKYPFFALDRTDFDPRSLDPLGTRSNTGSEYARFVDETRQKMKDELLVQNELDIDMYKAAIVKLCQDIHDVGLWMDYPIVSHIWNRDLPSAYLDVAPRCHKK